MHKPSFDLTDKQAAYILVAIIIIGLFADTF
jgi:hypothetical protein